ncbi:hypothetical protein PIB30_100576 [Stylosanthes scabra]|uniref:Uncharacterized protein n=1 Tax=Stylosanthes scabra TaxID=79078 RepID=A0ABU6WWT4_9FABA|nr:hypothetical protein [Stylosanthes scabra]
MAPPTPTWRPQSFLLLLPLTSPAPKLSPSLTLPVVSPHLVIVACLLARVTAAPPVKLVVARSPHKDRVLPFSKPASPHRYCLSSASRSPRCVAAVSVIPRQRRCLARPLCWFRCSCYAALFRCAFSTLLFTIFLHCLIFRFFNFFLIQVMR